MILVELAGGGVRIQAWRCTRDGSPGMVVYSLTSVLRALDDGYEVHVMAIDRRPDGSRSYHPGVLVLTESNGEEGSGALAAAVPGVFGPRAGMPVAGAVMPADGLKASPGTTTLPPDC